MQHDHAMKKLKFDLKTLSPGSGTGESATGKLFATIWGGQNICCHVAAFVIPMPEFYTWAFLLISQ